MNYLIQEALMTEFLAPTIWEGKIFDGRWSAAPRTSAVREPATGVELGTAGHGDPATIARVARAASAAAHQWHQTGPERRGRILREAARLLEANAVEIAQWIVRETGAVQSKADFEVQLAADEIHQAAGLPTQPCGYLLPGPRPDRLNMALRLPLGVVGVIAPWNFPLILGIRSVAPALALGNAVVLKPDPQTPVTGGVAIARLFEEAGLPEGLLSVVPGGVDVGEALVTDPSVRMITFTGSTLAGRRVGELAGKNLKRVMLELGGNNAMIVLDDCDVALAASAGAWGSFLHQGQICMSTGRHIVHRSVAEAYIDTITAKAKALRVGDPYRNREVELGPIINKKQVDRIHSIVTDSIAAGAELRTGGTYEGPFYKPTVLSNITQDMPAFKDEIFGPVAPVAVVQDEEEAINLANASDYGLVAAIQTGSLQRGLEIARRLRAGIVHVNDQTLNNVAYAPFGGVGQSGNGSRFGSQSSLDEFTEWRWVTAGSRSPQYPF
jgi:benzaldehyde dehydrogenase (NAD)